MNTVTFGTKNSYIDFGLILSSKSISLPKPKTKYINIPGTDGRLDLSTVLTNDINYDNRKLQFVFTVIDPFNKWAQRLSQVANYLHGKTLRIIMDWDQNFYYKGRCTINSFKSKKRTATITIDVDADPWKIERNAIYRRWEWDEFSFVDGIIKHNSFDICAGKNQIILENGRKVTSPTISCTVPIVFFGDGKRIPLSSGTTTLDEVKLREGKNHIVIESLESDTIEITWEGGSL